MHDELKQNTDQMAYDAEKKAVKDMLETQSKLLAESYEKSIAYTHLVIFAGYACFFGLWQMTKDLILPKYLLWSALLMIISAIVFVFFEIAKMYLMSKQNNDFNRIITDSNVTNSRETFIQAMNQYRMKYHNLLNQWAYWWHYSWIISVLFGVCAIGILVTAFVSGLLKS